MPRKRTSKKQSGASSRSASPPEERPVFFLDRDLGRYIVPDALRAAGLQVEVHADHFTHDAADTEWLTEVGRRGWIVLTKNRRILTNPLEIVCLLKARVFAFVLKQSADGELTGEQIAGAYMKAMPKIQSHVRTSRPPFVACVLPSGRVTEVEIPGAIWKLRRQ